VLESLYSKAGKRDKAAKKYSKEEGDAGEMEALVGKTVASL